MNKGGVAKCNASFSDMEAVYADGSLDYCSTVSETVFAERSTS